MSLRDDILTLASLFAVNNTKPVEEAYSRLYYALTPEAEVWLAALPTLMEMEGKATPAPWNNDGVWPEGDAHQTTGIAWEYGTLGHISNQDIRQDHDAEANCNLIVALRNALASAKAAGESAKGGE